MTDGDTYRSIHCRYVGRSPNAVAIVVGDVSTWIPLSLIHGADELQLRRSRWLPGDEITLRVMAWKVAKLGVKSS